MKVMQNVAKNARMIFDSRREKANIDNKMKKTPRKTLPTYICPNPTMMKDNNPASQGFFMEIN